MSHDDVYLDMGVLWQRFSEAALAHSLESDHQALPNGDSLWIWKRSSPHRNAPTLYISSGMHGDEPCGPASLLKRLESAPLPDHFNWVIAPMLNPSGYRLKTRHNGLDVDLNRDFLRMEHIEVVTLVNWWKTQQPFTFHISLHEDWEADGFYMYEINTCRHSSIALPLLEEVRTVIPLQEEGPVDGHDLTGPGLISHEAIPDDMEGWPEAIWLTHHWCVLSYTFEAPGQRPPQQRIEALTLAILEAEKALAGRKKL